MKRSIEDINEFELKDLVQDIFSKNGFSLSKESLESNRQIDLWQGYNNDDYPKVICNIFKLNPTGGKTIETFIDECQIAFNNYHPEQFLAVITSELEHSLRDKLVGRLGPFLQKKIQFFDISFLQEQLSNNPDIEEKYFPKSWHIYYDLITEALLVHYKSWIRNSIISGPGISLAEKLCQSPEFKTENTWIQKHIDEKVGIDPIHMFSSISGVNLKHERKIKRINLIFEGLGLNSKISNIDFTGCPTPVIMNLLSVRNITTQNEIWELFHVASSKEIDLPEPMFNRYDTWKGVDFASLTMFLFWSFSTRYVSLDKHTFSFLEGNRITHSRYTYKNYVSLCKALSQYNYKEESEFGINGIFRELVKISYDVFVKKVSNFKISINLEKFLNDFSKENLSITDSEEFNKKEIDQLNTKPKKREVSERLVAKSRFGFRIVSLKILDNCDKDIKGILKENLFIFDNCFSIEEDTISYHQERDLSFYTTNKGKYNNIDVNITALVGKNGSGKSTITELIFSVLNNVAYKFKDQLRKYDLIERAGVCAEIYWVSSDKLFCLSVENKTIKIKEYNFKNKKFRANNGFRDIRWSDFENLFYTIAVNYSIYSLNSAHSNNWISKLFHKNDGYQTPIVINPMRINGNIDINKENRLVNYRLMANLLQPEEDSSEFSVRKLTKHQNAHSIRFELDKNKNKFLYSLEDTNGEEKEFGFDVLKGKESEILEVVKQVFEISSNSTSLSVIEAEKYIIKKIISISNLSKEGIFDTEKNEFKSKEKIKKFLNDLRTENTHIGFKLKQAINYLKYENLWGRDSQFEVEIEKASNKIDKLCSELEKNTYDFNDFLPPPIFIPSIITQTNKNTLVDFEKLSSGEKQLIYSTNSILYHIKNIHSVHSNKSDRIKYRNIHLLLDEIELYYHPDLQKRYISHLLQTIGKMDIGNSISGISVLLVTHSPFILSDVPNQYLLRLVNGHVSPYKEDQKTFGSNIYDLLANDFFMEDGFIGTFAQNKIQDILDSLNKPERIENEKDFKKIIDQIGEPYLREELTSMYYKKYPEEYDKESKIRELQAQILKIKNA